MLKDDYYAEDKRGGQPVPTLIPELKKITSISCGNNHAIALDKDGNVFAWGDGSSSQCGRKLVERNRWGGLVPSQFGLPRKQIQWIKADGDTSFAMDSKNNIWAWGNNNFAQTGIPRTSEDDNVHVQPPQKVEAFAGRNIVSVAAGRKNGLAAAADGTLFSWGDNDVMLGMEVDGKIAEDDYLLNAAGKPSIIVVPQVVPGISAAHVASGTDNCLVITKDGKAYSWGFGVDYQLGRGKLEEDRVPTVVSNTAVADKKLTWAGCGGSFSIVTALAGN